MQETGNTIKYNTTPNCGFKCYEITLPLRQSLNN